MTIKRFFELTVSTFIAVIILNLLEYTIVKKAELNKNSKCLCEKN